MPETYQFQSLVPLLYAAEQKSLDGRPTAIGAFNVNFYSQAIGILKGLKKENAPGIVQASKGANQFQGGPDKIAYMVEGAIKELGIEDELPICLHLDHGNAEVAKLCIDKGYSSVMIDASKFDFPNNIAQTKKIVDYAHPKGVSVEGEYGKLEGVEEDIVAQKTVYANPERVPEFFKKTGCDALAIAYGTSHGPNKGANINKVKTTIILDCYKKVIKEGLNLKNWLVGHGSSTVPKELVKEINLYGGDIRDAQGVPMYILKKGIALGLRKINIDTDLRLGITATVRKYFHDNPRIESRYPKTLGRIKKAFDGEIQMVAKGKVQDPKTVIDPRGYLGVIDIKLLRNPPPEKSGLVELMGLIENRIADHVAMLVREFSSADLAHKVEWISLEEMAQKYRI